MLKSTTRTAIISLATAAFMTVGASSAFAQQQVDDTQLDAFVSAAVEVDQIRDHYQAQAASVESPEEMGQLEAQANAEMIDAVESSGLQVEEYNQIIQLAQQDPELDQRIAGMITEAQTQ